MIYYDFILPILDYYKMQFDNIFYYNVIEGPHCIYYLNDLRHRCRLHGHVQLTRVSRGPSATGL